MPTPTNPNPASVEPRSLEHNQNLHPGLENLARRVYGDLAGKLDGVPQRPALIQAEVLIVQLHGDRGGRHRRVAQRYPRQRVADQALDVVRRSNLDKLRHLPDEVVYTHLGAYREEELRIAEVLVFGHSAAPYEPVAHLQRHGYELGRDDGLHQIADAVVEQRKATAQLVVVVVGKILRTRLEREGGRSEQRRGGREW